MNSKNVQPPSPNGKTIPSEPSPYTAPALAAAPDLIQEITSHLDYIRKHATLAACHDKGAPAGTRAQLHEILEDVHFAEGELSSLSQLIDAELKDVPAGIPPRPPVPRSLDIRDEPETDDPPVRGKPVSEGGTFDRTGRFDMSTPEGVKACMADRDRREKIAVDFMRGDIVSSVDQVDAAIISILTALADENTDLSSVHANVAHIASASFCLRSLVQVGS